MRPELFQIINKFKDNWKDLRDVHFSYYVICNNGELYNRSTLPMYGDDIKFLILKASYLSSWDFYDDRYCPIFSSKYQTFTDSMDFEGFRYLDWTINSSYTERDGFYDSFIFEKENRKYNLKIKNLEKAWQIVLLLLYSRDDEELISFFDPYINNGMIKVLENRSNYYTGVYKII